MATPSAFLLAGGSLRGRRQNAHHPAPVGHILDERWFRLERETTLFLGPDEPFADDLRSAARQMHDATLAGWQDWARGLATPVEWQSVVIRAAIALKLCTHEETGAIVAALTT